MAKHGGEGFMAYSVEENLPSLTIAKVGRRLFHRARAKGPFARFHIDGDDFAVMFRLKEQGDLF
ncbi:hypothetical protein BH11ARM2_BH11ARM2_27390 [soil metagenome]